MPHFGVVAGQVVIHPYLYLASPIAAYELGGGLNIAQSLEQLLEGVQRPREYVQRVGLLQI